MKLDLIQNSPEWDKYRNEPRRSNASEAAIMLGLRPVREELIKQKALGIIPEYGLFQKELFKRGHEAEAAFRDEWNLRHGTNFQPAVFVSDDGELSVSVDGADDGSMLLLEHKLPNEDLLIAVRNNHLPPEYMPQVQQGMCASGYRRTLFAVSNGHTDDPESCATIIVEYDPAWETRLRDGWKQFWLDVDDFIRGGKLDCRPALVAEPKSMVASLPTIGDIDYLAKPESLLAALQERGAAFQRYAESVNQNPESDAEFDEARDAVLRIGKLRDHDKGVSALFSRRDEFRDWQRCIQAFERLDGLYAKFANALKKKIDTRRDQLILQLIQASNEAIAYYRRELSALIGPIDLGPAPADWGREFHGKTVDAARKRAAIVVAERKIELRKQFDLIVANREWMDDPDNKHAEWISRESGKIRELSIWLKKPRDEFIALMSGQIAQAMLVEKEQEQRAMEAARLKLLDETEEHGRKDSATLTRLPEVLAMGSTPGPRLEPDCKAALYENRERMFEERRVEIQWREMDSAPHYRRIMLAFCADTGGNVGLRAIITFGRFEENRWVTEKEITEKNPLGWSYEPEYVH